MEKSSLASCTGFSSGRLVVTGNGAWEMTGRHQLPKGPIRYGGEQLGRVIHDGVSVLRQERPGIS